MANKKFVAKNGIAVGSGHTTTDIIDQDGHITANTVTISGTLLNATSFAGTANNASYLEGSNGSYYTGYADNKAANAYSNATSYADTAAGTAYSNAASYADNKAANAYSNATSYADTAAGTAYSNAATYADNKAANAYSNAIAYSANATNISSGTLTANVLPTSGVTANTYGNSSSIPVITIDATGRITSATTNAVAGVTGFTYTPSNATFIITTGAGSTFPASISSANDSVAGIVKVLDSVSNTDIYISASANSVKTAYDNAATAYSNAATYADNKAANAYSNATSYAASIAGTAYSNATTFASSAAATAYTNAASYADTKAATAYSNATSYADVVAGTAYTNATSYAATIAGTAYSNATTFASSAAATAYSNAVSAASSSAATAYSNATTFAANASNISSGTLAEARLPFRMDQNVRTNDTVSFGNMTVTGNLTVTGTTVTISATELSIEDNMIYLNSNSAVTNPDLGIAGNYNDGTYRHAGFFRDASDGVWKVFDQYLPEPDASPYIDTANASFRIANFQANVVTAASFSGNGASVTSVNAATVGGNTAGTLRGYSDSTAATAYSNAVSAASSSAATAYSNAVSYAASIAGTAYSNATSYAASIAGTAYSNAVAYAASNTYVNSTFLPFSGGTLTGLLTGTAARFTNDGSSRVLYLRGSGNIIQFEDAGGTFKWEVVGRDGQFYVYKNDGTGSGYKWQIDTNGQHTITGIATFATDARAPIFYDSANTSYYVDPASTSVLSILNIPGQQTINTTTPGTTSYNLNFIGQGNADYAQAITWSWTTSGAQAGIYVQSSGGYGTKMYLATTDSFATGSKTAIAIDHSGITNFVRATPTVTGNAIWHAGNDGSGSGLDADLLDGQHGSYYAAASSLSSYLPLSGGTLTGTLTGVSGAALSFNAGTTTASSYNYVLAAGNDSGNRLVIFVNGTTRSDDGGTNATTIRNDGGALNLGSASYSTNLIGSSINASGSTIWHAGNDGAGSGLDADLLDGLSSGSFLRKDANDSTSAQYTFSKTDDHAISVGTIRGRAVGSQGGDYIHMYERVHIGSPSGWGSRSAPTYGLSTYGGCSLATDTGSVTIAGSTAWHAGNDGSGSGLDADLLDGINSIGLYNNMGQSHSTRTAFDASTPSYDFGYRFVQGNANGPGTGGSQFYSWYIGLGEGYPATGAGSYGAMFAVDRNTTTPYLSVRWNESNSFSAWYKIRAGYADSSGGISGYSGTYWTSANDGSGSGLDADTLDGVDSSGYWTKSGGWYGSGLPGSRLQGISASGGEFVLGDGLPNAGQIGVLIDGAYVAGENNGFWSLASDNTWGSRRGFTWDGSAVNFTTNSPRVRVSSIDLNYSGYYMTQGDWGWRHVTPDGWIQFGPANSGHAHIYTDRSNFYFNVNTLYTNGNLVWTAGNDGSGSGLDADLLDGVHIASTVYDKGQTQVGGSSDWNNYTAPGMYGVASGAAFTGSNNPGSVYSYGHLLVTEADGQGIQQTYYPHVGDKILMRTGWNNANWYSWQQYWTSTSDGSGSGLDADLLDGQNSAGFLRELSGGSGGSLDSYTDNGFRTIGYSGWSTNLLSFNLGSSAGTIQQEFEYATPSRGWRIRNKTDNATWSSWGYVVMTTANQGHIGGTVWHSGNDGSGSGLDADTLDGVNLSTSATASTVVARDSGGDIYQRYSFAVHFNQSSGNNENPSIAAFWTNSGSDNYCRKSTPAHVISQLGLWTSANDGSGSGLDADLLDGISSGSFTRNDTTQTLTNVWYFRSNRNTTSDSAPLQAFSDDAGGATMAFHRGGYFAVNFGLDSDNVMRIGGWSASANRWQLDMSGNMTAAGNITAYSDIRLKKDIQVIENAIEKVKQIRGVTFTRIDKGNEGAKQAGVIAQEVELVLPEVVSEDNSGIKNVAYGNMVGLLIEAIKEQQKQIEELKAALLNK